MDYDYGKEERYFDSMFDRYYQEMVELCDNCDQEEHNCECSNED